MNNTTEVNIATQIRSILAARTTPFVETGEWFTTIVEGKEVTFKGTEYLKTASFSSRHSAFGIILKENGKEFKAKLIDGIFYGTNALFIRDAVEL